MLLLLCLVSVVRNCEASDELSLRLASSLLSSNNRSVVVRILHISNLVQVRELHILIRTGDFPAFRLGYPVGTG